MYLVKCKFLDENKTPKGREYTYAMETDAVVGEIVATQEGKQLVVTATGVSEDEIVDIKGKLKYVSAVIDVEPDSVSTEVADIPEPDETIDPQELITVEQLPIITERLAALCRNTGDYIYTKDGYEYYCRCICARGKDLNKWSKHQVTKDMPWTNPRTGKIQIIYVLDLNDAFTQEEIEIIKIKKSEIRADIDFPKEYQAQLKSMVHNFGIAN